MIGMSKNELLSLLITAGILFLAAVVGVIFSSTSSKSLFSFVFAVFVYLVMPGYFILLNFDFSALERIIFGLAVSVVVVPIFLYVIDIFGFSLGSRNVIFVIFVLCAGALLARRKFGGKNVK